MKRVIPVAGTAAVLLVVLTACGLGLDPGPQTTQQRTVAGVHAVVLQTSGDLTIERGASESLTIDAGTNIIDRLTSEVVDGTLVLDAEGSFNSGSIRYTLTVLDLDRVELAGSGNVTGAGVLSGDATLTLSGSGDVTVTDLRLTSLTADLSGSGTARVTGSGSSSTLVVSGSGDFEGTDLATERTQVDVSGSGQARVNVSEELTATVTGSGDVIYTGDPASVQRARTGSGDIVAG
jgi:hypothetical protein